VAAEGSGPVDVDVDEVVAALVKPKNVDLTPFFASLSQDMVAAVSDNFDSSGGSGGTPWQGLAPSTLKRKAKAGKSSKPLIYNGIWQGSPTVLYDSTSAEVGTNVTQAVFHVSSAPRKKIPLRNPYDVGPDFYEDATERLVLFISTEGKQGQ
jgi:phage gpG-like protein